MDNEYNKRPERAGVEKMIEIQKGQKISLTKDNKKLKELLIGLGWEIGKKQEMDLDVSVFLLGENDKVRSEKDIIFYNQTEDESGAVKHLGDNKIGGIIGDAEQIKIDLTKVPAQVQKIDFTITIYEAETRKQNFGQMKRAYIRVIDQNTKEEILIYNLSEEYKEETAIIVGEIYRNKGEWKFQAIGSGFIGGLAALSRNYGVDIGRKSERASIVMYEDVKIAVKKLATIHKVKMSDIINEALERYIQEHRTEINKYDNIVKNL